MRDRECEREHERERAVWRKEEATTGSYSLAGHDAVANGRAGPVSSRAIVIEESDAHSPPSSAQAWLAGATPTINAATTGPAAPVSRQVSLYNITNPN